MLHLPVWSIYFVQLAQHKKLADAPLVWLDILTPVVLSLITAASMYINQVFDEHSDRQNEKVYFLSRGILTSTELMRAYLISTIFALGVSAFISAWLMFLVAQLSVLAYIYSVPPFRLKDRQFWGLFANAYGFGFLVPLCVVRSLDLHNIGLLGWDLPFYFLAVTGAVYLLTTIPDREGDRASNKRTFAVVWGHIPVLSIAGLLYVGACYLAYDSEHVPLLALAALALIVLAGAAMLGGRTILLATKLPILALLLLAGSYYWWYLVFVVVLLIATRIYYQRRFDLIYPEIA